MAAPDLWLDTYVLLDWLCDRQPWAPAAEELLNRAVDGHWQLWLSALSLANAFYIDRKQSGTAPAPASLGVITRIVRIAPLEEFHVRQALATGRPDFEDELQIASAGSVPGLTAIITRNLGDYAGAAVPAVTAEDWLAQHPLTPADLTK